MGSPRSHAHSHDHAPAQPHSHAPAARSLAGDPRARRALWFALCIGVVVMLAEVVAGVVFGSLALLGDAAHMLTDVGAYAIALWAARIASRPPTASATFGSGRVEILAALANGATLLAASAWIIVEAIRRLVDPTQIDGAGMSAVAMVGLVANAIVLVLLVRSGSDTLNMRGAVLHAAGDMLGSLAAVIAGVIILTTGWERADPIASILLTGLIVIGAWRLVRASVTVLLDVAPAGADADAVGALIVSADGVLETHDVHVWTMSPGVVAASAHVRVDGRCDPDGVLDVLQSLLAQEAGIDHTTFQVRVDRGSLPVDAVPRMDVQSAIEWATDHVARSRPDLSRGVIAAAAGAAALGLTNDGLVSPVAVSRRTVDSLRPAPPTD